MNLKDHFESLKKTPPPSEQAEFRKEVMAACFIKSRHTFYRWLNHPEQMPDLAKEKIQSIIENWGKDAN